jgi:hypothetical protein
MNMKVPEAYLHEPHLNCHNVNIRSVIACVMDHVHCVRQAPAMSRFRDIRMCQQGRPGLR